MQERTNCALLLNCILQAVGEGERASYTGQMPEDQAWWGPGKEGVLGKSRQANKEAWSAIPGNLDWSFWTLGSHGDADEGVTMEGVSQERGLRGQRGQCKLVTMSPSLTWGSGE